MLKLLKKYKFSVAYVLAIATVSLLFVHYPLLISFGDTASFSPWAILVGFWFVLRDFSQRELGHKVFIPMAIGVFLSYLTSPAYAAASVLASIASELSDWAMYTFTDKPFHKRILISSLASGPMDALVFLWAFDYFEVIPGVQIFNIGTFVASAVAKILAAFVIYYYYVKNSKKPKKAVA